MSPIETDINDKSVTLSFNIPIYDQKHLLQASKDFSENFWVIMHQETENQILINLKPKEENSIKDLNEIAYEFYNYALGLMQQ